MEQNPRFLEGHIECFVSDSSKSDQPCVLLFQSVLCLCATATLSSNASLSRCWHYMPLGQCLLRERKSISLSIHINPNKTRNHYCYRCHSLIILTYCGHLLLFSKLPQNSEAKANHEFYGSVIWRRHNETNMSVLHSVWGLSWKTWRLESGIIQMLFYPLVWC